MPITKAIPPRYFEREFGIEFAPFEWKRKEEMKEALRTGSKEIAGYVRWFPSRAGFLLVPTLTTADPCIFCAIEQASRVELPPERSFIIAKGKWTYWPTSAANPTQRFVVEAYQVTKPEIGEIKPDLNYKDCREMLFEGLYVIDTALKDLILHSFVSSPTSLGRTGGLSLSLYNEYDGDKRGQSRMLQKHLLEFLPEEVILSKSRELKVEGTSMNVTLEPFNWSYESHRADSSISKETFGRLTRTVSQDSSKEVSISMFSKHNKPRSLKDPVVVLADAPIIVTRDIEKRSGIFDPSPQVFQFMVASHMVQSSIPQDVFETGLSYIRQELTKLTDEYPLLRKQMGRGGILDLDLHGRPMSLLHLGLSDGRSSNQQEITIQTIQKAVELFKENADNTMTIWEMAFPDDAKYNLSTVAPEERRILGHIIRNGPSSRRDVYESCKENMSEGTFLRMWKSLFEGGLIFETMSGVFDIVPNLTDL